MNSDPSFFDGADNSQPAASHERSGSADGFHEGMDTFEVEAKLQLCWRCQKSYDGGLQRCSFCRAKNRSFVADDQADRGFRGRSPSSSPAIVKTVWAFAAIALMFLAVSVASEVTDPNLVEGTLEWAQRSLILIGVGDVAITVVVLISLVLIPLRVQWPVAKRWKTVWLAATPLLGLTIGLNVGYHFVLRTYLNIPLEADAMLAFPELLTWYILLICVQPAVVEELFFRHVALGAAFEVMSEKPAIMISSLLFAMAHLGAPLSMPYLAVLGAVLAWLRLKSGRLWLPIIFHFLHNLIVVIVL